MQPCFKHFVCHYCSTQHKHFLRSKIAAKSSSLQCASSSSRTKGKTWMKFNQTNSSRSGSTFARLVSRIETI